MSAVSVLRACIVLNRCLVVVCFDNTDFQIITEYRWPRGDMFVSLFCNFPTGPNLLSYCKILPTAHIYPQKIFWPFGPQNYLQILHFFLKNLPNPTYFPKNSGKSFIFFLKNRQNPSYSVNLPPKNFFGPSGQKISYFPHFSY